MKKALFFKKLKGSRVRCGVCEQRCLVAPGKRGACGVRENQNGTIYALNYGKTISWAIDPIEKKPLYHFLPGTLIYSIATVGCNLRCHWCQNWEISQSPKPQNEIIGEEITPKEHIQNAIAYNCPSIAYTYTEPTIFVEYALDIMRLAKKKGLKNIWVTNGYMSAKTIKAIMPYLDAANIDLKAASDETYQKYCGAKLGPILRNIKEMRQQGIHIEITTLIIPGVNDRPKDLKFIANFIARELGTETPWHLSRFFPAYKMVDSEPTPIKTLEKAQEIAHNAKLSNVYLGNI